MYLIILSVDFPHSQVLYLNVVKWKCLSCSLDKLEVKNHNMEPEMTIYHHEEVLVMFLRKIGEEKLSFEGQKPTFYLDILTFFYD
jgi:hypothetical protein